jgi:hypothetical protein
LVLFVAGAGLGWALALGIATFAVVGVARARPSKRR